MFYLQIISLKNIKKIPFAILFLVAIYYSSNLILEISSFVSLGQLFRNALAPVIIFWGLFFLLYIKQKRNIPFSFITDYSLFSYKTLLPILFLVFLFTLLIVHLSFMGTIYVLIGFVCIAGLLLALLLTALHDDCRGLAILLLIYPLILFIQHYFRWELSDDPYEIYLLNVLMPHEIVWLLMFLVIIAHNIIKKTHFEFNGIHKLFLLFGFFLLTSAVFSPLPLTSLKYLYRDSFLPIVFLFIFIDRIKTINDFKWLFGALLFSGMLNAVFDLYFFWRSGGFHTQAVELLRSDLATTVTGYVNLISILALIMLPLAVSSFLYTKNRQIKKSHLMFIVICLGIIILSKNRSAQISLIITSPFLFLLVKARARYIFIPFVIIVAMAITLKIPYVREMLTERYQKWFIGGEIISNILLSDSVSIDLWSSAIKIFLDNPIFGIGAGMWEEVYHRYTSMPDIIVQFSGNKPHSLPLQYFAYGGLGAGLSYVLLIFYIIIKCIKRTLSLRGTDLYLLSLGLFWSITALFLHESIRGYQIFNYYGYTVMSICLFFGLDNLLTKTQESSSASVTVCQVSTSPSR